MPRGAKKIDGPKSEVPGVAWDKNANKWKVRLSKGFILNPIVLTLSPEWLCKGIGKQKRKRIGHFNTQLEAENQMYKALKEFKASKKKEKASRHLSNVFVVTGWRKGRGSSTK